MRLKTYFDVSVEAAMHAARVELGPDAMMVHSKRTAGEARSLGEYEVVFSEPEGFTQPAVLSKEPRPVVGAAKAPQNEDLAGLREAVEKTMRLVRRSEALLSHQNNESSTQSKLGGDRADLAALLEDAGFSVDLRTRLLLDVPAGQATGGSLRERSIAWLQRQLSVDSHLGKPGASRKCVALVGPCGAGKTLSLVKLAAKFGITGRRPAQVISIDVERVGAVEALRAYTSVLGIGLQTADSPHALAQALAEHANKDLVLIDTPGIGGGAGCHAEMRDLGAYFEGRRDIDKHLVLPADVSVQTAMQYADRFAALQPDKLLFTKLDEAMGRLGPAIETAIHCGLPLSFTSAGIRALEDLEAAEPAVYLLRILPEWLDKEDSDIGSRSRHAAA